MCRCVHDKALFKSTFNLAYQYLSRQLTFWCLVQCAARQCWRLQRRPSDSAYTAVTAGSLCHDTSTRGQRWHASWCCVKSANSNSFCISSHCLQVTVLTLMCSLAMILLQQWIVCVLIIFVLFCCTVNCSLLMLKPIHVCIGSVHIVFLSVCPSVYNCPWDE